VELQLQRRLVPLDGEALFREVAGFPPNRLQKIAIEVMEPDKSYLVVAPTGSGKTYIGYYAIFQAVQSSGSLGVYLAPTRALGYEKYLELKEICRRLGCEAHIMNKDFPGSYRYFSDGHVVITTPWKLSHYLSIQSVAKAISRATVVVDEIHNMSPEVELVVSILKTMGARIVGLSATLREEDAREMAQWLSSALIMPELERPVPLFYHPVRVRALAREEDGGLVFCAGEQACGYLREEAVVEYVLSILRSDPEATVLVWSPTRAQVEEYALEVADRMAADWVAWDGSQVARRLTPGSQSDEVLKRVVAKAPVAFHHGGLSPANRNLVQELTVKRVFRVVVTAYTLAQGVNLPAKHVVITTLYGHGGELITPTEFHQLAGRAGRPGLDKEGHVHVLIDTESEFAYYREVLGIRAAPVTSKIADRRFLTRALLRLAAMGHRDMDALARVVQSTWYARVHGEEGARFIAERFGKILDELASKGYIEDRDGRIWFTTREHYYAATAGLLPEEKELADRADKVSEDELVRAVVEIAARELAEREGDNRYLNEVGGVAAFGLLAGAVYGRRAAELADMAVSLLQAMEIYVGRAYGYRRPDGSPEPRYRAVSAAVDSFSGARLEVLRRMKEAGIPLHIVKALARNFASQVVSGCLDQYAVEKADEYFRPVHGEKKWYRKFLRILEEAKCRD